MKILEELRDLQIQVNEIFNSEVSWEVKYDLIFSEQISQRVFTLIKLDYYDPDTSYQEDVTAFVNAFNEKMAPDPP